jgi:hypothetical protein
MASKQMSFAGLEIMQRLLPDTVLVKLNAFRHRVESLRNRCFIPLVGYKTREAGRLGQSQALAVALSFCRLLGLGCPKQAFAKNSDSLPK